MQQLGRAPDPSSIFGTPEHAARETEGREPAIAQTLAWLTFAHLPDDFRRYSAPFYYAAVELIHEIRADDNPELVTALHKLLEAKDSAMRAGMRESVSRDD